jgi:hypothetical protein
MASSTSSKWKYLDDNNQVQGPFTEEQMKGWFQAGYFTDETKVKEDDEKGDFTPIAQRHCPFVPGSRKSAKRKFSATDPSANTNTTASNTSDNTNSQAGDNTNKDVKTHQNGDSKAVKTVEKPPEKPKEREKWPAELKWFYIDSDGNTQGPFEQSKMIAWNKLGYFPEETPMRLEHEKDFATVAERSAKNLPLPWASGAAVLAAAAAVTAKQETKEVPPVEKKWFYLADGKEQGPWGAAQMRLWYQRGFFHINDPPLRQEGEPLGQHSPLSERMKKPLGTPVWAQGHVQLPATVTQAQTEQNNNVVAPAANQNAEPVYMEEPKWFYLDKAGKEQGPWPSSDMRGWWNQGLLDRALRVRKEHDTEYQPIGNMTPPPNFLSAAVNAPGQLITEILPSGAVQQTFKPTPVQFDPTGGARPYVVTGTFNFQGRFKADVRREGALDRWTDLDQWQDERNRKMQQQATKKQKR